MLAQSPLNDPLLRVMGLGTHSQVRVVDEHRRLPRRQLIPVAPNAPEVPVISCRHGRHRVQQLDNFPTLRRAPLKIMDINQVEVLAIWSLNPEMLNPARYNNAMQEAARKPESGRGEQDAATPSISVRARGMK